MGPRNAPRAGKKSHGRGRLGCTKYSTAWMGEISGDLGTAGLFAALRIGNDEQKRDITSGGRRPVCLSHGEVLYCTVFGNDKNSTAILQTHSVPEHTNYQHHSLQRTGTDDACTWGRRRANPPLFCFSPPPYLSSNIVVSPPSLLGYSNCPSNTVIFVFFSLPRLRSPNARLGRKRG